MLVEVGAAALHELALDAEMLEGVAVALPQPGM